jgi:hypothetical protein
MKEAFYQVIIMTLDAIVMNLPQSNSVDVVGMQIGPFARITQFL